ncbi:DegT/DnrJ/EryC1/StrS family aminotransferase [bacterium]|nr:DegT/DnrJ/EryC1/StrS family aminotransferase [bacterium]
MMQSYEQLEKEFGCWAGVNNVVACSSGTTALHLALEALQLPLGSKVLVPDYTMVACARAVTLAGLVPTFVDCGDDLLITVDLVREKLTKDCTAVMPVHIYGRQCDMQPIIDLAYDNNLAVVEDLAEAHGVKPHPATDAACWSFYQNKVIAGEEGGAVAFREDKHAKLARQLRCQGFTDSHDFTHLPRGINGRLSNANSALIIESLHNYDYNIEIRRQIEEQYNSLIPDSWKMPPRLVPWVYDIKIESADVSKIVQSLNKEGVQARHGFKPMMSQAEYYDYRFSSNALVIRKKIMYLPIHPSMTRDQVSQIVTATIGLAERFPN